MSDSFRSSCKHRRSRRALPIPVLLSVSRLPSPVSRLPSSVFRLPSSVSPFRLRSPVLSLPSAGAYAPAWWLRNPHTATLWGRVGRREPRIATRTERWDTPDGDFLEIVRLDAPSPDAPRILLLHGLEGGAHSHYAKGLFREAKTRGCGADLLLFRTCGSEQNRLARSYHSGETADARFVIERLTADFPNAPLGLIGVSLGANVLCKMLGELGNNTPTNLTSAVAISTPFDLARASRHLGRGFGAVYEWFFLKSLIPKALEKIARHLELSPLTSVTRAKTLWQFDDLFTAPLHGFRDAADYYARASALQYLKDIRLPTLLLSAVDDPFLPADVLDHVRTIAQHNPALTIEFPERGGHVGFTAGTRPWNPWYYGEWRAAEFLGHHAARHASHHAPQHDDSLSTREALTRS